MTNREKIIALAEKVKNPPSWWWKLLGGLLFFATLLWLKYLLNKKTAELATAKTELANSKLSAQQADMAAKVLVDTDKRKAAEEAAAAAMARVVAEEKALSHVEAEHAANLARINAVADKDWDALNKLAGVK